MTNQQVSHLCIRKDIQKSQDDFQLLQKGKLCALISGQFYFRESPLTAQNYYCMVQPLQNLLSK